MQWSWVSTAVLRTTENQMKITASLYSFIAFDMVDYLKLNLLFWPRVEKTHAYVHIYGVSFVISVFLWFYYCSVHVCVYGFFLLFASLIFRHINMSLRLFFFTLLHISCEEYWNLCHPKKKMEISRAFTQAD